MLTKDNVSLLTKDKIKEQINMLNCKKEQKQEAQLSQRDRATAVCVSFDQI